MRANIMEITDPATGEAALTFEERLRRAISIETVGVIFFKSELAISDANDAFLRMSGFSAEDIAAGDVRWDAMTPPEFMADSFRAVEELKSFGQTTPYEKEYIRKDGSRWWGLFAAKQLSEEEAVEFVIDISKAKQSEAALRASEERLRLLLESVQDYAIFTLDRSGRVTSWNEGARRLKGYTAEEIIGQPVHTFYVSEDIVTGKAEQEMQLALQVGRSEEESWRVRKDGSHFWANEIMTPLLTDDGMLLGFTKISRDLSERRHAEEMLHRRAEEFHAHFNMTTVGNAQADAQTGLFLLVNRTLCDITGYTEAELLQRTIWEVTAPEDLEGNKAFFHALVRGEQASFDLEKRLFRKDGETRWVHVSVTVAQRDREGYPLRIGAMVLDITERKQVQDALHASEERLRLTMESITDHSIITLDTGGCIVDWNGGAEQMFGFNADEAIGQYHAIIFTPEDRANNVPAKEVEQARSTGRAIDERWHLRKDGTRFYVSGVLAPLQDEGAITGFVKVAHDLTERKRAEEAMQRLNQTLESRVEKRTEQVRQLVTQLTMSEQEERRRVSAILHDDLQQRLFSLNFQLAMLRNLLDSDEVEDAKQFIDEIETDLHQSVQVTRNLSIDLSPPVLHNEGLQQAIRWLAAQMELQHGLTVTVRAEESWPRLHEDLRVLLFQIVRELLFNIVKHASVTTAVVDLNPEDDCLCIKVSDQGRGFDSHVQHPQNSQGLPRIQQRLQLIEGRMQINSIPGHGTSVVMHIPLDGKKEKRS